MDKVIRIVDKISDFFGLISGIAIVLGAAFILAEILARSLFNSTLYITYEYTGYLMVATTLFGLAYTLKEKGHIRLSLIHSVVKTPKGRTILDIFAFICGFIIFAIITYATFEFFWNTYTSGTRSMQISRTYLAIPQFLLPLGSFLMTLQFVSEFLKAIKKLKKGELEVESDVESEALGR